MSIIIQSGLEMSLKVGVIGALFLADYIYSAQKKYFFWQTVFVNFIHISSYFFLYVPLIRALIRRRSCRIHEKFQEMIKIPNIAFQIFLVVNSFLPVCLVFMSMQSILDGITFFLIYSSNYCLPLTQIPRNYFRAFITSFILGQIFYYYKIFSSGEELQRVYDYSIYLMTMFLFLKSLNKKSNTKNSNLFFSVLEIILLVFYFFHYYIDHTKEIKANIAIFTSLIAIICLLKYLINWDEEQRKISERLNQKRDQKKREIEEALSEMQTVSTQNNENVCSICLSEEINDQFIMIKLPCSHNYHKQCIAEWLVEKNFCPMCRSEVILNDGQ